jgi:hypothetical protein
MDGQDGVAGVVFVEEQRPELGFLEVPLEPPDAGLDIGVDGLALVGEFGEDFELLLLADDLPEELDVLLQQLFLLLQGLGRLLVPPDLGRG